MQPRFVDLNAKWTPFIAVHFGPKKILVIVL